MSAKGYDFLVVEEFDVRLTKHELFFLVPRNVRVLVILPAAWIIPFHRSWVNYFKSTGSAFSENFFWLNDFRESIRTKSIKALNEKAVVKYCEKGASKVSRVFKTRVSHEV